MLAMFIATHLEFMVCVSLFTCFGFLIGASLMQIHCDMKIAKAQESQRKVHVKLVEDFDDMFTIAQTVVDAVNKHGLVIPEKEARELQADVSFWVNKE